MIRALLIKALVLIWRLDAYTYEYLGEVERASYARGQARKLEAI